PEHGEALSSHRRHPGGSFFAPFGLTLQHVARWAVRKRSAPSWKSIAVGLLSRPGHQTAGSRTVRSPLMWTPQKGEVGAKVGMGPQPVMGHCTVAQQGDPHVDDIVGELAAVRVPLGA